MLKAGTATLQWPACSKSPGLQGGAPVLVVRLPPSGAHRPAAALAHICDPLCRCHQLSQRRHRRIAERPLQQ